jgi:hypothetical protein
VRHLNRFNAYLHMGRKPKLTELQRGVARERVAKGESAQSISSKRSGRMNHRGPHTTMKIG